jgi:Matrixin/IPT/TIG domain
MQLLNSLRKSVWVLILILSGNLYAGGQLLQPNPQDATSHYNKQWNNLSGPITWNLSSDGFPSSSFTNNDVQQILQASFGVWQQISDSNVSFTYGGEVAQRNIGIDGVNLITFTDQDFVFDSGALAMAIIYTFPQVTTITNANNDINGDGVADIANGVYPAGSIYETDIVFNSSYNFTNTGVDSSLDLQAIATHEIGHFMGLSHSLVENAVMYPFLAADITSARLLKADDISYISSIYPQEPAYSSTYGSISGFITNGFSNDRILGAHVYALDPATGKKVVGAYSLEQGNYIIPGLPIANYYVGLEPLDGSSKAADPKRINEIIANTLDTQFPAEFYDSNESNIETDTKNALAVSVTAGNTVNNIDLVTNTIEVPGVSLVLKVGLNLFSYPVETSNGFTAFDLLTGLGTDAEVNSIDRYNPLTGRYQRASWSNGTPVGENFAIKRGEAYLVHMKVLKQVTFKGKQDCTNVQLHKGFNLIGIPCPPAAYTAFSALNAMGSSVVKIIRYNNQSPPGIFETASFDLTGNPVGTDFPIVNGEGYVIESLAGKNGVLLPGKNQLFPPFLSGVSPGRAVVGANITIMGQGFSEDAAKNDVRINGVRATVSFASSGSLVVQVPSTASTGPIDVTIDQMTSNSINFIVENSLVLEDQLNGVDLIDGQTVQGELKTENEQDRYTFVATKDALVTVSASSITPGIPDLILAIESPTGGILNSDNNSGGGTNPLISQFKIPVTGRYTIVVSSVLNSGTGPYSMILDIKNRTSIPAISILKGDFQSGLMGTQLPDELEILVSGSTGEPVAGASITLVTSDNVNVTQAFTAASYTLITNSGGIVKVKINVPNMPGEYQVIINVPGYQAQTISVASLLRLPANVIVNGQNQTCGGSGCPVNQVVTNPYKITFLDNNGLPLEGVLVKFAVVSGGGNITGTFFDSLNQVMRSNAQGEVQVSHTLGTKMRDKKGNPIGQIVSAVASIPNSTGPIIFSPTVKSGPAAKIESLTGNAIRMMVNTVKLNAMYVIAKDQFDNPVSGADVVITTNDVSFAPGYLNGALLPDFRTNSEGVFSVQLTSNKEGPTIDEFGQKMPNAGPYIIGMTIDGAQHNFELELDLGPRLLIDTSTQLPDMTISHFPNGGHIRVGQKEQRQILFKMVRYQRWDSCKGDDLTGDIDKGDWSNDYNDIDLHEIYKSPVIWFAWDPTLDQVDYTFDVVRADGHPIDGINVQKDFLVSKPQVEDNARLQEYALFHIESAGDVRGEVFVNVTATIKKGVFLKKDGFCFLEHDDTQLVFRTFQTYFVDNHDPFGSVGPIAQHSHNFVNGVQDFNVHFSGIDPLKCVPPSPDPTPEDCGFPFSGESPIGGDVNLRIPQQTLHASFSFNVVSPRIEVSLNEAVVVEPPVQTDSLPDRLSYSGLDLTNYTINLNNLTDPILDLSDLSILKINTYPNFMQVEADGIPLQNISNETLKNISPSELKFVYYPTAPELISGVNTVTVDLIKDKAGNFDKDNQGLPNPLPPYNFNFP